MKRIFGIGVVWVGCCFAWVVLGSTLLVRSDAADASGSADVHRLWGPPAAQTQPRASYEATRTVTDTRTVVDQATGVEREVTTEREETYQAPIELSGTEVDVALALEHRRRGLNWYPTYTVDLDGTYRFTNDSEAPREVTFRFPLGGQEGQLNSMPSRAYGAAVDSAVYDGFDVREGDAEVDYEIEGGLARWTATLAPGQTATYRVGYRSRGTEQWRYRMSHDTTRTRDFRLTITTDFADVDFPEGTLSPTSHEETGDGWRGEWDFDSLIANQPIGVELPQRLNPGPLAARITFFAPVGMLFFFFVVGILAMAKKQDLHPMHYFFLGCAFFAFHLLFAYLVDHLPIAASFGISAVVSVLLVVSYTRLFVGWRFALLQVGLSQLLYLVLFSYTFMWEGFTGLSITIGAILTLFVMMQITGKTPWGKKKEEPAAFVPPPHAVNPPAPEEPVIDATPKAF